MSCEKLEPCPREFLQLCNYDIPNFESTFSGISVVKHNKTGFIRQDSNYITALSNGTDVSLYYFRVESQEDGVTFDPDFETQNLYAADNVYDLIQANSLLYLLSNEGNTAKIVQLNEQDFVHLEQLDLNAWIDTTYNKIDSLQLFDLHYKKQSNEILACGYMSSFGFSIPVVIALDLDINPKWIRPNLFGGQYQNIKTLSNGNFVCQGFKNGICRVTIDSKDGSEFQVKKLQSIRNVLYSDLNVFKDQIFVTGASEDMSILVKINNNLDDGSTTIYDGENSSANRTLINRYNNLVTVGYDKQICKIFLSESTRFVSSKEYCNNYESSTFEIPLAVVEDQNIGYWILSISSEDGVEYIPRLIKTDQEGATRLSPFSNKCD